MSAADILAEVHAEARARRLAADPLANVPFVDRRPANVDPITGELLTDGDPLPVEIARHRLGAPLPADWWEQRPSLAHIALAARARRVAPTAVLGCVLARIAAITQPTAVVPATVGGAMPLSTYVALIATSGGGKSAPMAAARHLIGDHVGSIGPIGLASGEGLVEAFLGTELDEFTGDRVQRYHGVEFVVDEGASFVEVSSRAGSTLAPTVCSAWSGAPLGQALASKDKSRRLAGGGYALGVVAAWQPATIAPLLDLAGLGLPQRWLYMPTIDVDAPHPNNKPTDPGALDWRPPTQPLRWHPDIAVDVDIEAWHRTAGRHTPRPLDAHLTLLRLKLCGLLAVLDCRTDIDLDDWRLAGDLVAASVHTRDAAVAHTVADARRREHATNERAARRELHVADAKTAKAVDSMATTLARRAHRVGDAVLTRRELREATRSADRALASIDDAIDLAVDRGWLVVDGSGWRAGGSQPGGHRG